MIRRAGRTTAMTTTKQLVYIAVGFVLIAAGIYLMYDFILKFLTFIVGLILFGAGIGFIARRK